MRRSGLLVVVVALLLVGCGGGTSEAEKTQALDQAARQEYPDYNGDVGPLVTSAKNACEGGDTERGYFAALTADDGGTSELTLFLVGVWCPDLLDEWREAFADVGL